MIDSKDLPLVQKFWIITIWLTAPWMAMGICDSEDFQTKIDEWHGLCMPFLSIGAWLCRAFYGYWGPRGTEGWLHAHMVLATLFALVFAASHIWLCRTWSILAGLCTLALAVLCLTQIYWMA